VPNPWDRTKGKRYSPPDPAERARRNATGAKKPQGESLISRKLKENLGVTHPGSVWWKNAGSEFGESGLPDIMGIIRGKLIAIEVKKGNGWFSPLQIAWLKKAERAEAVAIGMLFTNNKVFIIPTTAMGFKGNRKRELWVEIKYPAGLANIHHWRT